MRLGAVHRRHVDGELTTPEVDAVPLELARPMMKFRRERCLCFGERQTVLLGKDFRYPTEPYETVVGEIEQRAIQIEQHRVDRIPLRSVHAGYDNDR